MKPSELSSDIFQESKSASIVSDWS